MFANRESQTYTANKGVIRGFGLHRERTGKKTCCESNNTSMDVNCYIYTNKFQTISKCKFIKIKAKFNLVHLQW